MNRLEVLLTKNEISGCVNYNTPVLIEQKLLDLLETQKHLLADSYEDFYGDYQALARDPRVKSVQNGQMEWNVLGTQSLANLCYRLLDQVEEK